MCVYLVLFISIEISLVSTISVSEQFRPDLFFCFVLEVAAFQSEVFN